MSNTETALPAPLPRTGFYVTTDFGGITLNVKLVSHHATDAEARKASMAASVACDWANYYRVRPATELCFRD